MTVRLRVYRSANEIGGNCIEIAADAGRILLDIGRPLDATREATALLPETLDTAAHLDGLLISHPHQDHCGLLAEAPLQWPVFCGEATARLIRLTSGISGKAIEHGFRFWKSGVRQEVGPFLVTPFLTDHSAFDAYMLLIEAEGRRILYSGDFRIHGRKSRLVERLLASPPPNIDVLIVEGTNLGGDKPCVSESELETDFVALFGEVQGRVFVAWSAQNVDRTVTLYRACLRAGRTLVVDLYTAEVLEALSEFGKIPQPGWRNMKVVITSAFARMYRETGRGAFVQRMAGFGIPARRLAETPGRWVPMIRRSLIRDYAMNGIVPTGEDAWSWSMWRGYLGNDDGERISAWFKRGGSRARHLHTSGHASPAGLTAFANTIQPRVTVPIHGTAWDREDYGIPGIVRLGDGEPLYL
jgi:ribonuclease J